MFGSDMNYIQAQVDKPMVSHDLLRSTVTNQITFDQNFELAMDRCCQALISKLAMETLDTISFNKLKLLLCSHFQKVLCWLYIPSVFDIVNDN